jgi:hypothetical protein
VRDQDDTDIEVGLDAVDQFEDLRLNRHVERSGGLIGDQEIGVMSKGHRDHRPLSHPSGILMGVVAEPFARLGDADRREQFDGALFSLFLGNLVVTQDRLDYLVANPVEGVQARERVLEDHGKLFATDAPKVFFIQG